MRSLIGAVAGAIVLAHAIPVHFRREELMKLPCLLLTAGLIAAGHAQAQTQVPVPQVPDRHAAIKAVKAACNKETPKLCPGLSGNTALACLQSNIEQLSAGCKDAVVKAGKSIL